MVVSGTSAPVWAAAIGAEVLSANGGQVTADALNRADCVLVDAGEPDFVSHARHVHQLDDSIQIIAVTSPEGLQATRRAILYAPGLGEIWIASATDLSGALEERAAGVTQQRRRYERTRARRAQEAVTLSPQRRERAILSDAYLAGLLRVLADPVFSVDASGRVLSANAAAEAGIARNGPLIGQPIDRVLGIDGGLPVTALLAAANQSPQRVGFTGVGGMRRLGELRTSPMPLGGTQGWAVVLHDITESQQMVEQLQATARALQESEATYRGLVDAIPTLAWTARADGYIDWYNRRWYEYSGTSPADMEGWGWQSVHDPAVLPDVLDRWRRSIDTGLPFEMTFPIRSAEGAFRSFLTRVVPLRDENGAVIRWFGTNTDVQAERQARERIEHLQAVTSALAAVQTLDDVAEVVVATVLARTDAATGMLVVGGQEPLQPRIVHHAAATGAGDPAAPEARALLEGLADECLRTGQPIFLGQRQQVRDVAQRWAVPDRPASRGLEAVAALPLTVAGDRVGALTFAFTESRTFSREDEAFFLALARQCAQALERARLFAAERDARIAADEANRAKSQFLTTMSHELRTPLNAISGYVALVLEGLYGPVSIEQRAALSRVTRAQQHLLSVINDILSFARIESGRMDFVIERVDPAELIRMVLPLVEPQLTHKGLVLDTEAPWEGSPWAVRADRDKVGQILVNLLSNAIKFTPHGGRIRVTVANREDPEGGVEIRVADTGIGIAPEQHEAIFEPFMQVSRDLTRTGEGTGLGLAISRDLARGMGGELRVESALGQGATFILSLPADELAPDRTG